MCVCVSLQGKDMYLVLENNMLNLVDPMDRSVLHSQPIASIRVWGVGRDNGRLVILATSFFFGFFFSKNCSTLLLLVFMINHEGVRCHFVVFSEFILRFKSSLTFPQSKYSPALLTSHLGHGSLRFLLFRFKLLNTVID